jgi:hypothetical protein
MTKPKDATSQMQAELPFEPHFGEKRLSFDEEMWGWGDELTRTGELGRLEATEKQSQAA